MILKKHIKIRIDYDSNIRDMSHDERKEVKELYKRVRELFFKSNITFITSKGTTYTEGNGELNV